MLVPVVKRSIANCNLSFMPRALKHCATASVAVSPVTLLTVIHSSKLASRPAGVGPLDFVAKPELRREALSDQEAGSVPRVHGPDRSTGGGSVRRHRRAAG